MHPNFLIVTGALLCVWFSFSNHKLDPSNPPAQKTGAPGETTCGDSGCHNLAGTYTGTVSISGVPDTVNFNATYSVTIKNVSNAVRAGFEMTCLDNANARCGTFTLPNNSGANIGVVGTKQYPRQSTPKLLSNGSTSWTINWQAPASASGNKGTFYFVSLCANGNGQRTGDNVVLGKKEIIFRTTTTPVLEAAADASVRLFPSVADDFIRIELAKAPQGQLTILDVKGAIVKEAILAPSNRIDISDMAAGVYVAQIAVAGKTDIRKFVKI